MKRASRETRRRLLTLVFGYPILRIGAVESTTCATQGIFQPTTLTGTSDRLGREAHDDRRPGRAPDGIMCSHHGGS